MIAWEIITYCNYFAECRIRGHLRAKQKEVEQGEVEGKELRRLADEFHKERIMLDDMRRQEAMLSADINQKQLANNEVARMANAQQEEVCSTSVVKVFDT